MADEGGGGKKVEEEVDCGTKMSEDALGVGPGRIIKLSGNVYIAGQITEHQITALASTSLGSIINLRQEGEGSFLHTEAALCQQLGIKYVHVPMVPSTITEEVIDSLLVKMDTLPKPILVHCASAIRAGAMAVAHIATREQLCDEATASLALKTPFGTTTYAALKQLVHNYARSRVEMIKGLPNIVQLSSDLIVGPQLSEEHMRALANDCKVKTVINLRSPTEAGKLGLGALGREKELVESLGLVYVNIPTTAGKSPTDEEIAQVAEALKAAKKPVFLHCMQMKRTAAVVSALGLQPATVAPTTDTPAPSGGGQEVVVTSNNSGSSNVSN